ncbi:hypothetical protein [Larkinella sp. C7]|uniref:hypothetical protein n=1 Tax=Larkinella sp. C7 TaxID=2576607 RepID=UPI0011114113|nr:hypothetical protein [Larkinella sp. C7]
MKTIYLDWNIFTNLANCESIEDTDLKIQFRQIKEYLQKGDSTFVIPYSNAHLNDLYKSYVKGENERVQNSLNFISLLTNNICLTQYWGDEYPKWHSRLAVEHFNTLIENNEVNFNVFDTLFEGSNEDSVAILYKGIFDSYKLLPHNINFIDLKNSQPFFASLFQCSQIENSMYAVIKDVICLFKEIYNNPSVYNELRKIFKEQLKINPHIGSVDNAIEQLDSFMPNTILGKTFSELSQPTDNNPFYEITNQDKIIHKYLTLDFFGYNSDKLNSKNMYGNLFNDSLHCFYAAHCDVFVTNDKRTYKKSKVVFDSEGITTLVCSSKDFLDLA